MTNPPNPPLPGEPPMDDFDMRAAEFVLGTLDDEERRAIEAARLADPDLAAAIAYWEERLAPLADTVAPLEPPPDLWNRIEAQLPPVKLALTSRETAPHRLAQTVAFWRGTTIAALALAAGLAGLLLFTPRSDLGAESYAAAIVDQQGLVPAWFAETRADGSIVVTPLAKIDRPSNKDLELWALAAGAAKPVSLGVLPAAGRYIVPSGKLGDRNHLKLLVTLEQAGGSPNGEPTSAPIYGGELVATN
jgi:anti-sigma-K factor RskA